MQASLPVPGSQVYPKKTALRMNGRKSKVCPQKSPFLRMNDRKSKVCPQKPPFLRMNDRKSKVCPQKPPFLRMDTNFDGCHEKEQGASAIIIAPGS
jgi:hypothetical protein